MRPINYNRHEAKFIMLFLLTFLLSHVWSAPSFAASYTRLYYFDPTPAYSGRGSWIWAADQFSEELPITLVAGDSINFTMTPTDGASLKVLNGYRVSASVIGTRNYGAIMNWSMRLIDKSGNEIASNSVNNYEQAGGIGGFVGSRMPRVYFPSLVYIKSIVFTGEVIDFGGFYGGGNNSGTYFNPNLIVDRSVVPEPENWLLLIVGFALVGAIARLRQLSSGDRKNVKLPNIQ